MQVSFEVQAPDNTTPAVPIRLAGNLYQLGNTYADLAGGFSTLATRMPVLSPLPGQRYTVNLTLPAGADVRYVYTLGDGFWNADVRPESQSRQIIVPESGAHGERPGGCLERWQQRQYCLRCDHTCRYTSWRPGSDPIQPAVRLDGDAADVEAGRKPLGVRAQQPAAADRKPSATGFAATGSAVQRTTLPLPRIFAGGYEVKTTDQSPGSQSECHLLGMAGPPGGARPAASRGSDAAQSGFIAGVEWQPALGTLPGRHWRAAMLAEVQRGGSNWTVLSPTWTYTRNTPPILEILTGHNPLWFDLTETINQARQIDLDVALFPTPDFAQNPQTWWIEGKRDFAWWLVWYEQYARFLTHHADLAARTDAQALVIGGDWLDPALPGGLLADGSPSGVPADAETRWREIINQVRQQYGGQVWWALPFNQAIAEAPPFLDAVDGIYLLFEEPLTSRSGRVRRAEMEAEAARLLDTVALPLKRARISR